MYLSILCHQCMLHVKGILVCFSDRLRSRASYNTAMAYHGMSHECAALLLSALLGQTCLAGPSVLGMLTALGICCHTCQ